MRSEYFIEFYIDECGIVTINDFLKLSYRYSSLYYDDFYIDFYRTMAAIYRRRVSKIYIYDKPYTIYKQIEKDQDVFKVYHTYTGRYEI